MYTNSTTCVWNRINHLGMQHKIIFCSSMHMKRIFVHACFLVNWHLCLFPPMIKRNLISKRCLLQAHIASRTPVLRCTWRRNNTWGRNPDQIPRVHVWGEGFVPWSVVILVCIISKRPGCWSSNWCQLLRSQIALDYYAFPWWPLRPSCRNARRSTSLKLV